MERAAAYTPFSLGRGPGEPVDMDPILELAKGYGIPIVEDCAQAHGAIIDGKHVGTIGIIGCFSMYPGKNLGALGDAGICITRDEGHK